MGPPSHYRIPNRSLHTQWPTLLPELVQKLQAADLPTTGGVLATANSIFKRWVCVCVYAAQVHWPSLCRVPEPVTSGHR